MKQLFMVLLCLTFLGTSSLIGKDVKMTKVLEKATFAGGCFWCMEAPFDHLKGVTETISGYTGGHIENPGYQAVTSGKTGHAEAVQVTFDPSVISYVELLDVFWHNIDPTTLNKQFADKGTQYRTAIYYHSKSQQKEALASKKKMDKNGPFGGPIVTEITEADIFYPAEDYHQNYYKTNPVRYKFYRYGSGRDSYLKSVWGTKRGAAKPK
jgi:methionine-S-sulfoxide reductase